MGERVRLNLVDMEKINSFIRVWGMPILLAVISLGGLISALVGDGVWDVVSWIGLGIPITLMVRYYYFK